MRATRLFFALGLVGLAGCRNDYSIYNWFEDPPPNADDHGQYLVADVAPTGQPVIAYYDRQFGAAGFAVGSVRGDEVIWAHEKVAGYPDNTGLDPGDIGRFTAMTVMPDGTVWMAWHDAVNGTLQAKQRVNGPGSWTDVQIVDPGSGLSPKTGLFNFLAVDANNQPVIAYHDEAKGTLKVARYDGTAWSTEVAYEGTSATGEDADGNPVELPADVGEYARILVHDGIEYIAFYDRAHGDLHLLEGVPGNYAHSLVANTGDVGQWPSMAFDGADLLIAFQDVGNQDLVLARRTGGGTFSLQVVDDGEYRGADSEVFVKDGTVSLLYFNGHDNDLMRATSTGSGWSVETLGGQDRALGFYNEVVTVDGRWWYGSYDYTDRKIRFQPL